MHFAKNYLLGCVFLATGFAICSCNGRAPRKQLPDFDLIAGWEQMPFAKPATSFSWVGDTLIEISGKTVVFADISIPDPLYDSSALSLMNACEPFAHSIMEQWLGHGGKGIVIDLRSMRSELSERADLKVSAQSAGSVDLDVPIVLLWDANSAYRANEYLISAKAVRITGISVREMSNSRTLSVKGRLDCFSPSVPDFDGQ